MNKFYKKEGCKVARNCYNDNRDCFECGDESCERYRQMCSMKGGKSKKHSKGRKGNYKKSRRDYVNEAQEQSDYLASLSYIPD